MVDEDYLQGKPTPNKFHLIENPSFKIASQDEPSSTAVAPVSNAFDFDNFSINTSLQICQTFQMFILLNPRKLKTFLPDKEQ